MIEEFKLFEENLKSNKLKLSKSKLQYIFHSFSFHLITDLSNYNSDFNHRILETKIIIVDYTPKDKGYFIICFDKILLIIKQMIISNLQHFFTNNLDSTIYFLKDSKKYFDKFIICNYHTKNNELNHFYEDIRYFISDFNIKSSIKTLIIFWKMINKSIAGYLILKGYEKTKINRMKIYFDNLCSKPIEIKYKEDDLISLRSIYCDLSAINLAYSIEKEELLIIKKHSIFDNEIHDIHQREIENYRKISGSFPFINRFYGVFQNNYEQNLVLEFINGKTLNEILNDLNINEKKKILFEIMISIEYIHNNHFVYRDLKPNNIMIDYNKIAVLIDFDRMVYFNENTNHDPSEFTGDLFNPFSPPEFNQCQFFYESDIYSLGKIISYMFKHEINGNEDYLELNKIVQKCLLGQPSQRPKISQIINDFYFNYMIKIPNQISEKELISTRKNIHNIKFSVYWSCIAEYNNPYSFIFLGYFFMEGYLFEKNIRKSIEYFSVPANSNNNSDALYFLGLIYINKKYGLFNMQKSFEYYMKAAMQNHPSALNDIGFLYIEGKYVHQDINLGINYIKKAADLNNYNAISNLGYFYFQGKYVQKNVNKGIEYLTIAAKNSPLAQFNLGIAYIDGIEVNIDIKKGMHYLFLSAKQNYVEALNSLGYIYYEGKIVKKNIDSSIYYYTEAAKQNDVDSQYTLGIIYLNHKKDINKAIKYFTDAANQNDAKSLYHLGKIYLNSKKEIDKGIEYLKYAADLNFVKAQHNLGKNYYENCTSSYDIKLAIKYFTDAANQNYAKSQFYLGLIFNEGTYIKKDYEKAFNYFNLAANQNFAPALNEIGIFYYYGKYVKQDINLSIKCLEKASNYHYIPAINNLGYIFYIKKDRNKAIKYLKEAAKHNCIIANNLLGDIYLEGILFKQDINLAIKYYLESANKNDAIAQNSLGYIYENFLKDTEKAIFYYNLAANQNLAVAQCNLANIYFECKKDINKGIEYLKKAANNGYPNAQSNLGILYYEGKYLKQDIHKAIYYLNCSISQKNSESLFVLANIYYYGKYIKQNIKKSIEYFELSSLAESKFRLAVIYTEGCFVKQNIKLAIELYIKASNLDFYFAKNNLAIIYKNGFLVTKNLSYAEVLFSEIIKKHDDDVSMYNLAHLYIYNENYERYLDKSIDLLIKSSLNDFFPSKQLLSLAIVKKYKFITLDIIRKDINNDLLANEIYQNILFYQLEIKWFYDSYSDKIKNNDYSYDFEYMPILTSIFMNKKNQEKNSSLMNLTSDFYEGFDL